MARQTLDEILSDDSDLLDVKPVGNVASTEHQRVIDSFRGHQSLHRPFPEETGRSRQAFRLRAGASDKA